MVIHALNPLQNAIESMATDLFGAFKQKRPDLCANCYEHYGIVTCNEQDNLIGQDEIERLWGDLTQTGVTAAERSIPRISFQEPDTFIVYSSWLLNTGDELHFRDTWVRQEDGSFRLLMQNIDSDIFLRWLQVA